ncbi:Nucleotide sugar dehydrogenase [Planctomycetales bacterium 10988]|nr:Nucleotide sugar dehydrogenase [Planctomycetales bacterium 10988]
MKRIAVFGTGYVGCVTAACLARDGHRVIGVDIDAEKVAAINTGESPVSEPGLEKLLCQQVEEGRLSATTEVAYAVQNTDIALIAVGTPSRPDGSVSTDALEAVTASIGESLRDCEHPYHFVVRSTLLPGLLETVLAPLLERTSGRTMGSQLRVGNHPEFLRESTAIQDYDRPPFIVVGTIDDWDGQSILNLYHRIHASKICTDARSAALLKYACNSFHALKVVFANEIGSLARQFGADGMEVMRLLCQDENLNISPAYLRPGFAFGGSCLPKDVRALVRHAEQEALSLDVMRSILPSNDSHLRRALAQVQQSGHRQLGLIGLSFKADTDDLRESPMVTLVEILLGRGFEIKIYDPDVRMRQLRGRNRAYVNERLPHLAKLLVDDPQEIYEHASLLMLGNNTADRLSWQQQYHGEVLDLRADLVRPKSGQLTAKLSAA